MAEILFNSDMLYWFGWTGQIVLLVQLEVQAGCWWRLKATQWLFCHSSLDQSARGTASVEHGEQSWAHFLLSDIIILTCWNFYRRNKMWLDLEIINMETQPGNAVFFILTFFLQHSDELIIDSWGQNFNLFNSQVSDKIPVKLKTFPSSVL